MIIIIGYIIMIMKSTIKYLHVNQIYMKRICIQMYRTLKMIERHLSDHEVITTVDQVIDFV